jgi:AraC family transcriptional regulator, transcriptional activator of the genes for pyochelin and ferripyochelin receptors
MRGTMAQNEGNTHSGDRLLVRSWNLDGFEIAYWEGNAAEPWDLPLRGKVTLLCVQKGGVTQNAMGLRLMEYQHAMIFPGKKEYYLQMHAGPANVFILQINPATFLQIIDEKSAPWGAFHQSIKRNKEIHFSGAPLNIDLAIQTCLNSIINCEFEGDISDLYLRSKVLELIALQAHCVRRQQSAGPQYAKTEYDRERLLFAKEYLLQNMATPPTLPELARIAGINEFKLKRGFKELFGNTVFGYLAAVRLEMAKAQLNAGGKRISEIAFDLGYSSLQHFSAAFKKRFGVPPNRLV